MTYTHVADFGTGNAASLSLTTNGAGNFLLCQVQNQAAGSHPTGLSSSNVTWTALGTLLTGSTNSTFSAQVFLGVVTAASTATLTATFSGTGTSEIIAGAEFTTDTGTPALDVQGNLDQASGTTWKSLTPAASGELYWGVSEDSGSASSGSTSGYVYNASVDGHGNGQAYNLNCTGGVATAPAWADSGQVFGIMVLVAPAASSGPPLRPEYMQQPPAVIVTGAGWRGANHSR